MIQELGEKRPEAQLTTRARVVGDKHSELLIRYQRQIRMEPARVTAMADDAEAVAGLFVKAQRESWYARIMTERSRVHLLGGRLGEDALAVERAVVEVGDHELRHIGGAGGDRAGGRGVDDLELLRFVRAIAPRVSLRHVGAEPWRQRLPRRRLVHA